MIHKVKGFSVVNEEIDGFLEFSCFLHDPMNVGNFVGCSSLTGGLARAPALGAES